MSCQKEETTVKEGCVCSWGGLHSVTRRREGGCAGDAQSNFTIFHPSRFESCIGGGVGAGQAGHPATT